MNQLDNQEKIIELTERIALNPSNDTYYLERGKLYLNDGCNDKAIKDFTTALGINPKRVYSLRLRARVYHDIHNYVEELNDLTEAIKLTKSLTDSPYYYYARAVCYIGMQSYVEAIDDLTEAIKLQPNRHAFYMMRASTSIMAIKTIFESNQAIHAFAQILRDLRRASKIIHNNLIKLSFVEIYKHCGLYYLRNKCKHKAINNFSKSIKIASTEKYNSSTLYYLRSICYINEIKKSIDDISEAIKQEKDIKLLEFFLETRSLLYWTTKQYSKSVEDLVIINNITIPLLSIRSACYYEIKEYDKSLEDLSLLTNMFYTRKNSPINEGFLIKHFELFNTIFPSISKEKYQKMLEDTYVYKDIICESIDENFIINIIKNETCPTVFFLRVLEVIFDLKKFKFYEINFDKMMISARFSDCFMDKINSEINFINLCADIKNKNLSSEIQIGNSHYKYWKKEFEKNGSELFFINSKLKLLESISREFLKETLSLPKNEYTAERFDQQSNFMLIFFKINKILQETHQENLEKKEQEKAQAKIDERNKVIADLSHSIKNLISTVIDPLENMKKETVVKQPIIDSAIRGANLVREIVNAMSLSYKGSIDDFRYDAINNNGRDKQDMRVMILESVKSSIGNMYDGKYFSVFQEGYFDTKQHFIEAKSDWNTTVSQSKNLEDLSSFLNRYFFDLIIDIEQTEDFITGNERGSAVKLLILFGELILNAIKYSAFVKREIRFVKIEVLHNDKEISILVENRFNPRKRIKTTGLGNIVITNFAKLLNTSPVISRENEIYSVHITFENFWERSYSL